MKRPRGSGLGPRIFAAALFVVCGSAAFAVPVPRASSPIRVDAVLDEAAWQGITPIAIDREWFPGDNIPAAVQTDVLVTWDDENLYVAFRAFDPQPGQIRARYADRDEALLDDTVGFLVDPFNDKRIAYQFRVNPLGVQADAINSEVEGSEDFSWDAIWESAGRITAEGYIVEMAIPLQQLRIPAGEARTWGFMAMRDYPRSVRHRFRSVVTDENRNCLLCQFGEVSGIGVTRVGRNIELTPTLTGNLQQDRSSGALATEDQGIDLGISGRWAITPGTSLQATINPDFSHVEADAAQLDVNTRFALSFPEKRPFFLEGADFFETQMPLLFTRTIADPAAGLKLTGKTGSHTYGVLLARDEITNFLVPFDQSSVRTSIDDPSTTAVFRYRLGLGEAATAGAFLSSRTGSGYSNTVLSGDTFVRLSEQDSVRVQLAGSQSAYPAALAAIQPEGTLTGHALLARYTHSDRDWFWAAGYVELSPEFRADTGLFNQVGLRSADGGAQRRVRGGPERWFSNLYFGMFGDARQEWSGDWTEWGADIVARYQGPRQSYVTVLMAPNQEHFDDRTYHNMRYGIDSGLHASPDASIGFFVNWGESIDFTNSREAEFVLLQPYTTLHIGRRFSTRASWVRQVFRTPAGDEIFTASIPQATMLYHFNGRTFLRAIVQHRSVDRNPEQYVIPVNRESRGLLSQLLFSYRLNAQTVFLAGYSDNYAGTEVVDLTQTNRALFVKLSYAWLF
ncbi:MAG TPA: sugar-binding protein [Thermoanaerobaculia bacterium]|nr:sugar-binding protein [Thermoanaerobaculia bacterium]